MQHAATRCHTLPHTATLYNTPQHTSSREAGNTRGASNTMQHALQHNATTATHYCNTLQQTAAHQQQRSRKHATNSLQHCNATHCKTHWNPPQHTSSKEVGSTWGAANTMQHALQHNAILQNATATHCNTLHLTAAHLQQRSRKHSKRN